MANQSIRLVAFDLDGTLTQHKTPLGRESRALLNRLRTRYQLLIVGAGDYARINRQMNGYPIDIIGNYGMQVALVNSHDGTLSVTREPCIAADREATEARVRALRARFGWTQYAGASVEYHASGVLTLPLLGTSAALIDKLHCDPTRQTRRAALAEVREAFPEYTVFVGGSSSFDIVPRPYCKRFALEKYCAQRGLSLREAAYAGDDYGPGGNDEDIKDSGVHFIPVDDYKNVCEIVSSRLL